MRRLLLVLALVFGLVTALGVADVGLVSPRLASAQAAGSPGVDEVRWYLPVRPGDGLTMRVTIQEVRESRTKPDRGVIRPLAEVINQRGEVVLSLRPINLVRRRPG